MGVEDLIDEKARNGLADLRVEVASETAVLQAGVDRAVELGEVTLKRVVEINKKLDAVCKTVEGHDFWIRASKRFMGSVCGVAMVILGAVGGTWILRKMGL